MDGIYIRTNRRFVFSIYKFILTKLYLCTLSNDLLVYTQKSVCAKRVHYECTLILKIFEVRVREDILTKFALEYWKIIGYIE